MTSHVKMVVSGDEKANRQDGALFSIGTTGDATDHEAMNDTETEPRTATRSIRDWLSNPYLLMSLAILCWAGNWLLGRAMRAEVTPVGLNFWRWLVALTMMMPFVGPRLWSARWIVLRHWKIMFVLSLTGAALFQTLVYLALTTTTAINAALFNSTTPIMIGLITWLLFRERTTRRQMAGIAVSLAGVVAIVTRGDPAVLLHFRFNPGDLWALASVPTISVNTVLLRKRPVELEPVVFLAAMACIGTAMLAPFYLWELAHGSAMGFNVATVASVLYVAFFASIVAFILWIHGVAAVGPVKAGLLSHLHPFFTTVMAILFLGETLRPYHAVGIVLIFGGIYLATATQHGWRTRPRP